MISRLKNTLPKKILITGGAGFIGGALIRKLLKYKNLAVTNLDKINYASDYEINSIYKKFTNYNFIKADLNDKNLIENIVNDLDPDIIIHSAAETHVDRSIESPLSFINNNIYATYNLLEASKKLYKKLSFERKQNFLFYQISTDEVYGSIENPKKFHEQSPYAPKSPYSASKASSDQLVMAWRATYDLPSIISNCSNNYGPKQFPEKLIPISIINAFKENEIKIYGDGLNMRDWIFVNDHVDAIIKILDLSEANTNYCIGANQVFTNIEIVEKICRLLDSKLNRSFSHLNLIKFVEDRPGHDRRYAIDSSKLRNNLDWSPNYNIDEGLEITIDWYLQNIEWSKNMIKKSGYKLNRLGLT